MSILVQPVLRRWDGKLKEATVWDSLAKDPELSASEANCSIYLSQQHVQRQQPSFIVPFDQLVYAKCQPLIEKASAPEVYARDYASTSLSQRAPKKKAARQTCSLCLEPPQHYDGGEVIQYHVTTRNFFAWMMGKPIVGPDPASALLALKVRMDLWRARSADNFAALYQYARVQGYGDLGDIQLFLTKHIRGLTAAPTGYKLMPASRTQFESKHVDGKMRLKNSLKNISWLQGRKLRPRPLSDSSVVFRSRSASDVSIIPSDNLNDTTVMSGAVPPAKDINNLSVTTFLPMRPVNGRISFSEDVEQALTSSDNSSCLHTRPESRRKILDEDRRYSLPNMPHPSHELYRQSSWMQNLTREHYQLFNTPQQTARLYSTAPIMQQKEVPTITHHLQGVTTSKQRRPPSRSRAPSPIQEEELDKRVKIQTPLALQTWSRPRDAIDILTSVRPVPQSRHSIDIPSRANPTTLLESSAGALTGSPETTLGVHHRSSSSTSLPLNTSRELQQACPQSVLPSHSAVVCRSCSKPKSPESMTHDMQRQSRSRPPESARRVSFEPKPSVTKDEGIQLEVQTVPKRAPHKPTSEPEETTTRFPSLKGRNKSNSTSIAPPLPAAPTPQKLAASQRRYTLPNNVADSYTLQSSRTPANQGRPVLRERTPTARPSIDTAMEVSQQQQQQVVSTGLTESPSDLTTPISPLECASADMSKQASTSSMYSQSMWTSAPVSQLFPIVKSQVDKEMLINNNASGGLDRAHRVPLDDESRLGSMDIQIMDQILYDMGSVNKRHSVRSNAEGEMSTPTIERLNEDVFDAPKDRPSRPSSLFQAPEQAKDLAIKRLRNSLKTWHSKRPQDMQRPHLDHQGYVLVMDRFGKFDTLPSPAKSPKEKPRGRTADRSQTPLCELP